MDRPATLLNAAALAEGATGVALMWAPGFVVRMLLAADLDGAALTVARIAGMALVGFALACWLAGRTGNRNAVLSGLLVYNLLVGAYFVVIGIEGATVGPLLWPAAAFHIGFAGLVIGTIRSNRSESGK